MSEAVVSVVIPVYKTEKYLDRCLESIVNQSYRNLEIILVDDGSPDGCPSICDEWAKNDKRIKVVHKQNEGLGYARNTGIENATGEYICFVDSDDYIDLRTVESAYKLANEYKTDIVTYGYFSINPDGAAGVTMTPDTPKTVYENEEIMNYVLPNLIAPDMETGKAAKLWMSTCGCLFSMNLIKRANWRLVSERDIISEDVYSLLKLYKDVKRVGVIREALYYYCVNMASLSHTYKSDRFKRLNHFYNVSIKLCNELDYSEKIKWQLAYPYMSNVIGAMKIVAVTDNKMADKLKILKDMVNDETLRSVLSNYVLEHEKRSRKLFIQSIRDKRVFLCYLMLKLR